MKKERTPRNYHLPLAGLSASTALVSLDTMHTNADKSPIISGISLACTMASGYLAGIQVKHDLDFRDARRAKNANKENVVYKAPQQEQ